MTPIRQFLNVGRYGLLAGVVLIGLGCDGPSVRGLGDADVVPAECTGPRGQTLSSSCCPAFGRDACGALLFCAALDGRTQPTCYPERSRLDRTPCPADYACVSSSCNAGTGLCRSLLGNQCDEETGCAPSPTGGRAFCDASQSPSVCVEVGNGDVGEACGVGDDCDSGRCEEHICRPGAGGLCSSSIDCDGLACAPCEVGCADGAYRCVGACEGYECTDEDLARSNCYARSISTVHSPLCPMAPPTPTCSALRDDGVVSIRVTWPSAIDDQVLVRCGDSSTTYFTYYPGSPTTASLEYRSAVTGGTYTCTIQRAHRTSHPYIGWLLSPESPSCTVVSP